MHRLAPPAQQGRVARPHAQRGSIGCDVRTAFVDDPDGADRHTNTLEIQTIRLLRSVDHLPDRIGQIRDSGNRIGNTGNAPGVQRQPVQHRLGQPIRFSRGDVQRIGLQHRRSGRPQRVGRMVKRSGARVARHRGKLALDSAGGRGQTQDEGFGLVSLGCRLRDDHAGHTVGLSTAARGCQARCRPRDSLSS